MLVKGFSLEKQDKALLVNKYNVSCKQCGGECD